MGEFDSLFNQSITLEVFHSIDQYGDPSYNAGSTVAAKIDLRIKKVVSLQGKEAVSTTLIVISASVSLDLMGRDRITLPTNMGSKQPVILTIENAVDNDTGINDHWEVST